MNHLSIHAHEGPTPDVEIVEALAQTSKLLVYQPAFVLDDGGDGVFCFRHRELDDTTEGKKQR
jgi:hypothetical protein